METASWRRSTGSARRLLRDRNYAEASCAHAHLPPRTLQHWRVSRILWVMEIHFTPEQETQLAQIANQKGTDAERLVKDAAMRLLEEDARFRAAVREGIAQADRGEFIEEEEMNARLERMLSS